MEFLFLLQYALAYLAELFLIVPAPNVRFCFFVFCEALLFPTYAQDPFGDNFYVPFRKATQV